MNFLAHIYLSGNDEEVIIGNFIGDFVKGKEFEKFNPEIQKGIRLHRQIDDFTDNHPIVAKSKKRLRGDFRHYSPVIVDVFYDHFLATLWDDYSAIGLEQYTEDFYALTADYLHTIPPRAQNMLSFMKRDNWLLNYGLVEGINLALTGMSRRTKFDSKMDQATISLRKDYEHFKDEFVRFFPELQDCCHNFLMNYDHA